MRPYFMLFCLLLTGSFLNAQTLSRSWLANGGVKAIATQGGTIYIGGDFTYLGPRIAYLGAVDGTTGFANLNYAQPDGQVIAFLHRGRVRKMFRRTILSCITDCLELTAKQSLKSSRKTTGQMPFRRRLREQRILCCMG
jgi:hypothetical protein